MHDATKLPTRIGRLLLMVLQSDQAGEVAAAAAALKRTLANAGMDPHAFAAAVASLPMMTRDDGGGDGWRAIVVSNLEHCDRLPEKEIKFLRDLLRFGNAPSAKQCKWLFDIHDRLHEKAHS